MRKDNSFKSNSSGQTIILTGFVIAVIIVGMGTILHSTAISGTQESPQVSESTFHYFENVREEYGTALMVASDEGKTNPFNRTTTLLQFENKMKKIVESHGFLLNVTWDNYSEINKWARVTILFADGNRLFNDTVTYNLVNGDIVYDEIPPGRIMDLHAVTYPYCDGEKGAVILNFTAVGDDGYEDGTSAYYYDVRFSKEEITNNTQFYDADSRSGYRASENGTQESIIVPLPGPGLWYFSVKAIDEENNPSTDVSNNTGFHFAVASNFSPTIQDVIFDDSEIISDVVYEVNFSSSANLTFNVTDLDNDTVDVFLMMKNDTSGWYPETNWTLNNTVNITTLNYTISNIMGNFSFYIKASDYNTSGDLHCINITNPYAPESVYLINVSTVDLVTVVINSTNNVSDSYIDKKPANADTNYDTSGISVIGKKGGEDINRGLIWFNLSAIPEDAVIISANISLYATSVQSGETIDIHKVNGSWNETTITWNIFNGLGYNNSISDTKTPSLQFTNWIVTEDIKYYMNPANNNFGWILKYSNEASTGSARYSLFTDKNSVIVSQRPYLTVIYYE